MVYTRCVQPAVESFARLDKQNNRRVDGQVCWVGLGEGEHLRAGGLQAQERSSQEPEEQARGGTSYTGMKDDQKPQKVVACYSLTEAEFNKLPVALLQNFCEI